jgi:hypothetical protein
LTHAKLDAHGSGKGLLTLAKIDPTHNTTTSSVKRPKLFLEKPRQPHEVEGAEILVPEVRGIGGLCAFGRYRDWRG